MQSVPDRKLCQANINATRAAITVPRFGQYYHRRSYHCFVTIFDAIGEPARLRNGF